MHLNQPDAISKQEEMQLIYSQLNILSKNVRWIKKRVWVEDFVSKKMRLLSQNDIAEYCGVPLQSINRSVFMCRNFPCIPTIVKLTKCFSVYTGRAITVADLMDETMIERFERDNETKRNAMFLIPLTENILLTRANGTRELTHEEERTILIVREKEGFGFKKIHSVLKEQLAGITVGTVRRCLEKYKKNGRKQTKKTNHHNEKN